MNVIGKDIFVLLFTPKPGGVSTYKLDEDGNKAEERAAKNQVYGFYVEGYVLIVEDLLNPNIWQVNEAGGRASNSCSASGSGIYCGAAIKLNGWRIPDEYPKM